MEIQFANKKINDFSAAMKQKEEETLQTTKILEQKNKHLADKNKELQIILDETEQNEAKMEKMFKTLTKSIDTSLLESYQKIRSRVKNGLAVVSFDRGAAEGSFLAIPPQMQIEIAHRTRIYADEYSGRILVDTQLAEEEKMAFEKELKK